MFEKEEKKSNDPTNKKMVCIILYNVYTLAKEVSTVLLVYK